MKILIERKYLDRRLSMRQEIELEGKIFTYTPNADRNNPGYMIFAEEQENWQRLNKMELFRVPIEALGIPHETGGAHGDLRLRYKNGNIIFFPEKDYWDFFRLDDLFLAQCEIIYAEQGKKFMQRRDSTLLEDSPLVGEKGKYEKLFIKGNKNLLDKYGVRII